jgi:hypothetical protein
MHNYLITPTRDQVNLSIYAQTGRILEAMQDAGFSSTGVMMDYRKELNNLFVSSPTEFPENLKERIQGLGYQVFKNPDG